MPDAPARKHSLKSAEVVEGDRVRVIFENKLPEPTTVHWHGLEIPIEMDGTPFISQPMVEPGGIFIYEFTVHQNGTFFYHSHGAMQEMMGMMTLVRVLPEDKYKQIMALIAKGEKPKATTDHQQHKNDE